jgi:hypothetical protein
LPSSGLAKNTLTVPKSVTHTQDDDLKLYILICFSLFIRIPKKRNLIISHFTLFCPSFNASNPALENYHSRTATDKSLPLFSFETNLPLFLQFPRHRSAQSLNKILILHDLLKFRNTCNIHRHFLQPKFVIPIKTTAVSSLHQPPYVYLHVP